MMVLKSLAHFARLRRPLMTLPLELLSGRGRTKRDMKVRPGKPGIRPEPLPQDRRELVYRNTGTQQDVDDDRGEDRHVLRSLRVDDCLARRNGGWTRRRRERRQGR